MTKFLTSERPRFTNLLKKLPRVQISSFTKQCVAFLTLYTCFFLMHQMTGFKVQLWLSLCVITAVVGWFINYISKRHSKKVDILANSRISASNVPSVSTKFQPTIFRAKDPPLLASWKTIRVESSHRDRLTKHEEKAPLFRSLTDGINSTKKTEEQESRPSSAPRLYSPFSKLASGKENRASSELKDFGQPLGLSPKKEISISPTPKDFGPPLDLKTKGSGPEKANSVSSSIKDFGYPTEFKVETAAPLLATFRDLSPSANTSISAPNTTTQSRVSDGRETRTFQDSDLLSTDGKEERTLTYEKSDPYSATLPSFAKLVSSTPSLMASVTANSDHTDGQGSHKSRRKSMDKNKKGMSANHRKRSKSLRSISCFPCCGGKHLDEARRKTDD